MNDLVRAFLIDAARDDKKRTDAERLTLADIQAPQPTVLDRDEMKPLREIVASMLGLRPIAHAWAAEYGPCIKDTAGRASLALLVKRTNLLANELKTGAADLRPGDKVRVDKVLDIAVARGWTPLAGFPGTQACVGTSASAKTETQEERQARRFQLCVDEGLKMPNDDYARLPNGIRRLADREGITRQSFASDVKAYLARTKR